MLHDLLENTISEVHADQERDNLWHGSKFEKIDKLKNKFKNKRFRASFKRWKRI